MRTAQAVCAFHPCHAWAKKSWACLPDQAYHVVLAVNRVAAGFRGINGRLPAKRGSPSIYSTTRYRSIDRCARRDSQDVAEHHTKEDHGGIVPSVSDWLSRTRPESWMSRGYALPVSDQTRRDR